MLKKLIAQAIATKKLIHKLRVRKKVYAAENCPTHPSLPQKITVRPLAPVSVL